MHHNLVVSGDPEVLIAAQEMARIEVYGRAFVHAAQRVEAAIALFDVTVDIFGKLQFRVDVLQIPGHGESSSNDDFSVLCFMGQKQQLLDFNKNSLLTKN